MIAGPLLAWLLRAQFVSGAQQLQPVETISITSRAIRFERRPPSKRSTPIQPPAPRPEPRAVARAQPEQAPHRELARITPRAPVSIPRETVHRGPQVQSFSQQLAQQQQQFTKTIAKLREENNPVSNAAQPVTVARKRYTYDFSGSVGSPNIGQGILYPLQAWQQGPWDYYYVRYWVLYPDGTSETGTVPWPVRFPQSQDPIKLGWRSMPLPGPEAGYVLPSDANPHPLVAFCYEHRFAYCPVARD